VLELVVMLNNRSAALKRTEATILRSGQLIGAARSLRMVPADAPLKSLLQRSRKMVGYSLGCLLLVTLLFPQSVMAASNKKITVGSGTPASCTQAALQAAVSAAGAAGGGTITFNCGVAPATIPLTPTALIGLDPVILILPTNTTIDGGDRITLAGSGGTLVFVDQSSTAVIRNITLQGVSFFVAGCIYNQGTLTIDSVTLSACRSLDAGGILNRGTLTVTGSTLEDNNAGMGGAIWHVVGTVTVERSTFMGNTSDDAGGAIASGDTLIVRQSTFSKNEVPDTPRGSSGGGAIYAAGTVSIDQSRFSENNAVAGGAIIASGVVTIDHSTFTGNGAVSGGGGIVVGGTATITHSDLSQNIVTAGPGGAIDATGTVSIEHSNFSENDASFGGAIFSTPNSSVSLDHSTLSENRAGIQGGGIYATGALTIDHSTVIANTAETSGGGIFVCEEGQIPLVPLPQFTCKGTLTLTQSSVTGNTPDDIAP
jgi:predicted outer membrane repeat protein